MEGWGAVLYLALLSTVLANLIFFTLLSRQSVSRLSIQLYLIPAVSVVGGITLLSEPLNLAIVVGGAILLFAVTIGIRSHRQSASVLSASNVEGPKSVGRGP